MQASLIPANSTVESVRSLFSPDRSGQMRVPSTLSFFHISDIHFTGEGQPANVDAKTMEELGLKNRDDLAKVFLSHIPAFLAERASKQLPRPQALIVNGD